MAIWLLACMCVCVKEKEKKQEGDRDGALQGLYTANIIMVTSSGHLNSDSKLSQNKCMEILLKECYKLKKTVYQVIFKIYINCMYSVYGLYSMYCMFVEMPS